jgi:hypothetical protein
MHGLGAPASKIGPSIDTRMSRGVEESGGRCGRCEPKAKQLTAVSRATIHSLRGSVVNVPLWPPRPPMASNLSRFERPSAGGSPRGKAGEGQPRPAASMRVLAWSTYGIERQLRILIGSSASVNDLSCIAHPNMGGRPFGWGGSACVDDAVPVAAAAQAAGALFEPHGFRFRTSDSRPHDESLHPHMYTPAHVHAHPSMWCITARGLALSPWRAAVHEYYHRIYRRESPKGFSRAESSDRSEHSTRPFVWGLNADLDETAPPVSSI